LALGKSTIFGKLIKIKNSASHVGCFYLIKQE